MNRTVLGIVFALGALMAVNSWAETKSTNPTAAVRLCPPISALKKTAKLNWVAKGGWKSYDLSFVHKVGEFLGAQWNGSTVGQITCVYSGVQAKSFPILLVYNTLAVEPRGGKWSKNLGGYRNCKARKQKQCAFTVLLKPKSENIYNEALQLRNTND